MENVFLGVSGGVDSFVAALLLKQQGYNVTGVYLDMGTGSVVDTEKLSERLGIEIVTVDASEPFEKYVTAKFTETYFNGGAPSPCVECNKYVKWDLLRETADAHGGGLLSTGHYCMIAEYDGLYYVEKGKDTIKDQSYYMWKLEQDVLSRAVFPLGGMLKQDVRKIAVSHGYTGDLEKKESMGLCFLKNKSVKEYLLETSIDAQSLPEGEIRDKDGNLLGTHDGYPFYTLAQRKGLAIRNGCVVAVDKEKNILTVGDPEDLYTETIKIDNLNIISVERLENCRDLTVKVRGVGRNPAGKAQVTISDGKATIILSDPAWAVTKGQPVVFYENGTVLGGGEAM